MSASLVGSEMCIRDRTISMREESSPNLARQRAKDSRSTLSKAFSSQGKPVSYTHLTLPTICSV
eukprot:436197-Alexandrium_andersonii.AAC.1